MTDDSNPTDGPTVTEVPAPEAEGQGSPRGVLLAAVVAVILLAVAVTWFLSGDGDDQQDATAGAEVPALDGRSFTVAAITEGGRDRAVIDAMGGGPPVLAFAEDRITVSGCNGAGGSYRLDGDRLDIEVGPSTTMACGGAPEGEDPGTGQALMDQDAWFTTFFEAGPVVAADGDAVTLTTADAVVRLVPAGGLGPDGFWGSRWQLVSISGGGTSTDLASLDGSGPEVVLDTAERGRVGFRACNQGSGAATFEEDRLVVSEYGTTEMACTDPSGETLMALDAAMATLLTADPTVTVDGDELTLATDTTTASFRRLDDGAPTEPAPVDPDAPVASDPDVPSSTAPTGPGGGGSDGSTGTDPWGSAWEITELCAGAPGEAGCRAPVPTREGQAPSLDLTVDGRLGFSGCNGGSADASLVAGADGRPVLEVGPVVSTKMGCVGPDGDALQAQDGAIAALLEAGPGVLVEGDRLTLTTDAAGSLVATRRP